MSEPPVKVLCLDIEGGSGGSSRSLYHAVEAMDRSRIAVEVWCKRQGPVQARYEAIGVPVRVMPAMPKASALPRLSRNLLQFMVAARDFRRARPFLAALALAARAVQVVHLNHEALFQLARWLRRSVPTPLTSHFRTIPEPSVFARWQARTLFASTAARAFISENERDRWLAWAGRSAGAADQVIYNPVADAPAAEPHAAVPRDARLKVACLSNYAWIRGVDRLVDVAVELAARGRNDILFVLAGTMRLPRSLPGALGDIARKGGTLADYATARGVADRFLFLGHVPDPERVLAACDVLAKPTREDNPWGRDILEAMAAGRPVVTNGSYDRFVRDGENGVLLPAFETGSFAQRLAALADDRALVDRLGAAARAHVLELCDARARAADLAALWRMAAAEVSGGPR